MGNIKNEAEFWIYMEEQGPKAEKSKNNYISWLRFVSYNFAAIDDSISVEQINSICSKISASKNQRDVYKTNNDVSNIKSALNKYLKFTKSNLYKGL